MSFRYCFMQGKCIFCLEMQQHKEPITLLLKYIDKYIFQWISQRQKRSSLQLSLKSSKEKAKAVTLRNRTAVFSFLRNMYL